MPDLDGDECWHALQLTRMLQGQPYSLITPTGLPLSLFHGALELPLLIVFGPSPAILRIPTVLTGILAVALIYFLGSKLLDRATALIAAGLLAVLPVATYCARTGYESSHAPLFTLILVYFAFRSNVLGMSLLLMCSYFVHPTNIFLLPLLLAVMAVKTIEKRSPGDPWPWRLLALKAIPPTLIVVCTGLMTIRRPQIQHLSTLYQSGMSGRRDPLEFLKYFGRFLLGLGNGPWPRVDLLFWSICSIVFVLGTFRLIRSKQWDRVALVGGALASMAALCLTASSSIIQPGMIRYGYFLIVPTVLAFACLLRSLLLTSTNRWAGWARSAQVASLFVVGWVLLLSNRLDIVHQLRTIDPADLAKRGEESPWTLHPHREDPRKQAFDLVVQDLKRSGTDRGVVICTDVWSTYYFELLGLSHPGVEVVGEIYLTDAAAYLAMLDGTYTIGCSGPRPLNSSKQIPLDRLFHSGWIQHWEIPARDGAGFTTVRRLAAEFPVAGDFDHDGKVDPAIFRRSDSHWIATLSGGGTMDVAFGSHDRHEFPVPGDYDGDHKIDLGVFRPKTDQWVIQLSSGICLNAGFGMPNVSEIPIPGDYDGDGKTDIAIYFPSNSTFVIQPSNGATIQVKQFGSGDRSEVAVGDYDGDGKLDLGVYIPDMAQFLHLSSRDPRKVFESTIGTVNQSIPALGDYDGDGKTDLAVYDPALSLITYRPSKGGPDRQYPFGLGNASVVAPGDYDGDGKTDLSVYIPNSALLTYRPSGGGNDVYLSSTRGGLLPAPVDAPKAIAVTRPALRK